MQTQAKYAAPISLGIMGAGFAATIAWQGAPAVELLQGGFEAGLVGGLADWFAVTALFRHPLGIPIPHTALLPRNREKVTQSLINVIQNDVLTEDSIIRKINELRLHERLLSLAEKHISDISKGTASLLLHAIEHMPMDRVTAFVTEELKLQIQRLDTSAILGGISDFILSRGYEQTAFLYVLDKLEQFAVQDSFRDRLGRMAMDTINSVQLGGFMQFAVNAFAGFMTEDKLGGLLQSFIMNGLRDMRHNSSHSVRLAILEELRQIIRTSRDNPKWIAELDSWKMSLVESEYMEQKIADLLVHLRQRLLDFVREPSFSEQIVQPLMEKLIADLKSKPDTINALNDWMQNQLVRLVEQNHSKIGRLIKENVDRLDNETLIEMMETKIGKDLQWIRVNGAVCGFLIGIVLGGIKLIF
jgi:uncharacterized membrane-anchored protein YjiN (DUF445 family)